MFRHFMSAKNRGSIDGAVWAGTRTTEPPASAASRDTKATRRGIRITGFYWLLAAGCWLVTDGWLYAMFRRELSHSGRVAHGAETADGLEQRASRGRRAHRHAGQPVQLAVVDIEVLGDGLERLDRLPDLRRETSLQEGDVQRVRLLDARHLERLVGRDGRELGGRPHERAHLVAECLLEVALDLLLECGDVGCLRLEDHVAA